MKLTVSFLDGEAISDLHLIKGKLEDMELETIVRMGKLERPISDFETGTCLTTVTYSCVSNEYF